MQDGYETLPYKKYKVLIVWSALLIKEILMQKGLGFLNSSVDVHLVCLLISRDQGNSLFLRFIFLTDISIVLEHFKDI